MATRKTTSAATTAEHSIIVEKNEQYNFFKITCPEGHYLTTYNEGDDISLYSDSKEVYTPLTADTSKWHCVTEEEHAAYIEARDKANEERMEAERAAMMSDRPAPME